MLRHINCWIIWVLRMYMNYWVRCYEYKWNCSKQQEAMNNQCVESAADQRSSGRQKRERSHEARVIRVSPHKGRGWGLVWVLKDGWDLNSRKKEEKKFPAMRTQWTKTQWGCESSMCIGDTEEIGAERSCKALLRDKVAKTKAGFRQVLYFRLNSPSYRHQMTGLWVLMGNGCSLDRLLWQQ